MFLFQDEVDATQVVNKSLLFCLAHMDQSPQPPRTSVGILVLHWAAATVHRSSQRRR
jgi:hypothetical protein